LFQLENFKRVFLNFASVHINLFFHGSLQFVTTAHGGSNKLTTEYTNAELQSHNYSSVCN